MVKIEGNRVFLPKIGWVKYKGLRKEFVGKIKTLTVSYEAYQDYASILLDIKEEPINSHNSKSVGI